jgi:hypothetical protein
MLEVFGTMLISVPTLKAMPQMTTRKTKTMNTGTPCEVEHDFVLVLAGVTDLTPKQEDALFEAGCDDATISLRFGTIYLTFTRFAPTLKEAVLTALRDVRKANIGAVVRHIDECNLVTQAEIARRIKRSRQLVHQYITGQRGPGGFPGPDCYITEEKPLWRWCEVAYWLRQNNMIKEDTLRDAQLIATINSVLEFQHQKQIEPSLTEEILQLMTT